MAGSENIQGRAIFISYRRDDSEGEAGRLFDDLVRAYDNESVFMDVAGIEPGLDFRKAIDANVASCGVLLAVIGPSWASVTDSTGARRLDNANDFVRLEIASALARQIAVIPVLVHGAKMPPLDQLPDDLKDLRYRNSVEITHARWNSDVALLTAALKSYVSVKKDDETKTVHATVPVQLPAPQAKPTIDPVKQSKLALFISIGALAVIVLAVVIIFANHRDRSDGHHPVPEAAVGQPANLSAAENALLGRWKDQREPKEDDDLVRITVADFGGQITVHAWGKCPDKPCDWGSKSATLTGEEAVTETWDLKYTADDKNHQRKAALSLRPVGELLQVTVKNTLIMPNGETRETLTQLQFARMQPESAKN
jgi:hypothetical protein